MKPHSARKLFVVLAVVTAVNAVVVGAAFVIFVLPVLNRPAEPPPVRPFVEAYLDAVANGDAAGALAMTQFRAGSLGSASTALLGDEALRGAHERITDPRVMAVDVFGHGGHLAQTTVEYTLASEQHIKVLSWDYDEDTQEWRVVDGLLSTLSVEGLGGDAVPVQVAGVTPEPEDVCYEEGAGERCGPISSYVLFPGVYEVRADLSGFEVHPRNTTPVEQLVTITPGSWVRVSYMAVPRGDSWPIVNGNPTDPSLDLTDG